jgi:hypothetical protein
MPWLGASPGRATPTQSYLLCMGHVWYSTTTRGGDTALPNARAALWLNVSRVMAAGAGDASREGPRTSKGNERACTTREQSGKKQAGLQPGQPAKRSTKQRSTQRNPWTRIHTGVGREVGREVQRPASGCRVGGKQTKKQRRDPKHPPARTAAALGWTSTRTATCPARLAQRGRQSAVRPCTACQESE